PHKTGGGGGDADRSPTVGTRRHRQEPRCDGDGRSPARASRAEREVVGIARGTPGERLGVTREAELGCGGRAKTHRSRIVEHRRELVAVLGNEPREGAGSEGGLPTGARDEGLVAEGQP